MSFDFKAQSDAFVNWHSKCSSEELKYNQGKSVIESGIEQNNFGLEQEYIDEKTYTSNSLELRNSQTKLDLDRSNFFKENGEYDSTLDGKIQSFDSYDIIAIGELETYDKNEDSVLDFSEWTSLSLDKISNVNNAFKVGAKKEDYKKALENGEDILDFVDEAQLAEFQDTFDTIKENQDQDYVTMDDLAYYQWFMDQRDGEDDGVYHIADVFNTEEPEEQITIAIDKFTSDEKNNIDCPSRLIQNIYGVSYYSEEGQEIWNQLKELNPGLDENNFENGKEIRLN